MLRLMAVNLFLASLTKSLFDQHFISIGIVAHDQEKTEVQVMALSGAHLRTAVSSGN